MSKVRVFADTNVILEAFRTGCWTVISTHYQIETVEKCIEEVFTGNPQKLGYVAVPAASLTSTITAHKVSSKDLASLVLKHPTCSTLDDGEKHLLAWLYTQTLLPTDIFLTTADKAALVATHSLGLLDKAASLESLSKTAGVNKSKTNLLANQYTENWLSNIKTKIRFGIIP